MHCVTISSSACHSSSKRCVWPNHKHSGHSSKFLCVQLQPGNFAHVNLLQHITQVHVNLFLLIINGFKNLQNVKQLVSLPAIYSLSVLSLECFVALSTRFFPIASPASSTNSDSGFCLCVKTSTLKSNFYFTRNAQLLCALSRQVWVWWALVQKWEWSPLLECRDLVEGRHPSLVSR